MAWANDDQEKGLELPSIAKQRRDRTLWLGRRISGLGTWIEYDNKRHTFVVIHKFAYPEAEPAWGMDVDRARFYLRWF